VLVAEDNAINREVAVELLSAAGLCVETANNGREAVDKVLAGRYDLVLMDMQMPTLDGLGATRRLREAGQLRLPIVAMTANAFGEDRVACLAAGMNDHVSKPVDPEQLYAALLRWLPKPAGTSADPPPPPKAAAAVADRVPRHLPLQDRLAAIDGLDVGQALDRLGGNMTVVRRVLQRFAQIYGGGAGPMDREVAHSLRGACATVGAVDLCELLQAYEALAAAQPGAAALKPQADRIDTELSALVRQLQAELAEP
jgi:CheY-like chemotaxis protein